MGNSTSSSGRGHHDDTVDFGQLSPQGVYTGPRDWNQAVVAQLIGERKLAPYYRPLEDYEESWDDEQILAARKDLPDSDTAQSEASSTHTEVSSHSSKSGHHKNKGVIKEVPAFSEARVYRGAVECPICFLYYPPNINHSRCCDQAICTECFVQIKRAEPTTTHIVSEPAACPYCVQDNFGVVYTPPPWRTGINSSGMPSPPWLDTSKGLQSSADYPIPPTHKRRQKSFGHDSPEVVTTDQIRPDWEAKLAAVRAAVTRRANRRIIMRQVGDRLIPVGVTSGRVHALTPEEAAAAEVPPEGGGSRRSRRRQQAQNQDFNQLLGSMGLGGPDLEELMIMEAMRLSLIEHEEQQRKEAQNKNKGGATAEVPTNGASSSTAPAINAPTGSNDHRLSSQSLTSSNGFSSGSPSPSPVSSHQAPSPLIPHGATTPTPGQSRVIPRGSSPARGSRSPSPAAGSVPGSQSMQKIAAGRRPVSSPPPFSTLSAALSAAATASAVLSNGAPSPGTSRTGTPSIPNIPTAAAAAVQAPSPPPLSTSPADNITVSDTPAIPVPTIRIRYPTAEMEAEASNATEPSPTAPSAAVGSSKPVEASSTTEPLDRSQAPQPESTAQRPIPLHTDSFASSLFSAESSQHGESSNYDFLTSESDSPTYERAHLLGGGDSTSTLATGEDIRDQLA